MIVADAFTVSVNYAFLSSFFSCKLSNLFLLSFYSHRFPLFYHYQYKFPYFITASTVTA